MRDGFEKKLTAIFSRADVTINGDRAWDIHVKDPRFYERVLAQGSLGLGESYMDGWWTCDEIDQLIFRLLKAKSEEEVRARNLSLLWHVARAKLMNLQTRSRAYEVGKVHYDTGNELFRRMLDKRMVYSCGYWKDANTLDEAQEAKLDLVCRKIGLEPGQTILDIGCGWGSFIEYAAERYGVEALGITISNEQAQYARERCKGLPITIEVQDYRSLDGQYDHVVSIGMFEHVGYKNYKTFMAVVSRCLKDDGLFLLHTIGQNTSRTSNDPWVNKYIFPNGMTPSPNQVTRAIEGKFIIEDWHCFGLDYYRTIMAWYRNVVDAWPEREGQYDERCYRMWT